MEEPADEQKQEPKGFGEHTRRSSSENAHQQGWGLNEDERRRVAGKQQAGGTDYDYGAQDFGDTPSNMSTAGGASSANGRSQDEGGEKKKSGAAKPERAADQRTSARRG